MTADAAARVAAPSAGALSRAESLGRLLRSRGWTCATAESCTGGGIANLITAIAGSSDYFVGGIVAYSNPIKSALLHVSEETLRRVGAVSAECAGEMVRGARRTLNADVALASTGIAGPGGATARKPVGLVYIGVATPEIETVRELHLVGGRHDVIGQAIIEALNLALESLGAGAPEME